MTVQRTVADLPAGHAPLEIECVDRQHLNVHVPLLQPGSGIARLLRAVCGPSVPSSVEIWSSREDATGWWSH